MNQIKNAAMGLKNPYEKTGVSFFSQDTEIDKLDMEH